MSVERIMVNGHELTAFDLPPEPSETYTVNVDGLGEIAVEKGKPPKEKDVPAMYMRKLVPELCEQNAALFRENAKLRELVVALYHIHFGTEEESWDAWEDFCPCGICEERHGGEAPCAYTAKDLADECCEPITKEIVIDRMRGTKTEAIAMWNRRADG